VSLSLSLAFAHTLPSKAQTVTVTVNGDIQGTPTSSITGSFTMLDNGDFSTIANVNIHATLPINGTFDYLWFNAFDSSNSSGNVLTFRTDLSGNTDFIFLMGVDNVQYVNGIFHDFTIGLWTNGQFQTSQIYQGGGLDYWTNIEGNVVASDALYVNVVPEPSTWAMMLLGFVGLGVTLRARRRPLTISPRTRA
jgi:hypothetical protein